MIINEYLNMKNDEDAIQKIVKFLNLKNSTNMAIKKEFGKRIHGYHYLLKTVLNKQSDHDLEQELKKYLTGKLIAIAAMVGYVPSTDNETRIKNIIKRINDIKNTLNVE